LDDGLADVVVTHLGVVLVAVLERLRNEVLVALTGEVDVLVRFMDTVERAHLYPLSSSNLYQRDEVKTLGASLSICLLRGGRV
jgi:hypothetical protein